MSINNSLIIDIPQLETMAIQMQYAQAIIISYT